MKTVKKTNGSILRVKDLLAEKMVDGTGVYTKGDYEYCSKSEWKKTRPKPTAKVEKKAE